MATQRITASFATRRDAEMAVETLVQEYGVPVGAVETHAEGRDNSSGTRAAGADGSTADGEYAGRVRVAATVEAGLVERLRDSFRQYGGGVEVQG
ncbi:hypothetical protein BKE38_16695 [Pseudoroseomonas deserti]|uniref:Uncharacterized protein n=1 Tax=Teichococcus deserti TaxID=1817963 RepID=A0A1V2GZW6_9PROT|nr:hypothetical protein [Pseudoroseomonas deserti]ONG51075.1 hypothetical protein BKE38_16695 [Pseudoroseomonas deserti]